MVYKNKNINDAEIIFLLLEFHLAKIIFYIFQ